MVAMDDFELSYLELPYYTGVGFGRVSSTLLVFMTIFGKSCDLKIKIPKTQAAYIFFQRNKIQ